MAARYGETGASAYLLPLSVDGLIVVASICLVELGGHISTLENEARAEAAATARAARVVAAPLHPASADSGAGPAADQSPVVSNDRVPAANVPGLIPVPAAAHARRSPTTAAALAEVAAALPRASLPKTRGAEVSAFSPTLTRQGRVTVSTAAQHSAAQHSAPAKKATARANPPAKRPATKAGAKPTTKSRRSPAETLEAATRIKATRPDITEADLATELGISASRWRTIRREAGQEDLRLAA